MIFFLSTDQLKAVCRDYHERIKKLESEKYDLEKEASLQTNEVNKIVQIQSGYLKSKLFSFSLTKPTLKWIIYVENCKISGFIVTKVCLCARKKFLAYISNTLWNIFFFIVWNRPWKKFPTQSKTSSPNSRRQQKILISGKNSKQILGYLHFLCQNIIISGKNSKLWKRKSSAFLRMIH